MIRLMTESRYACVVCLCGVLAACATSSQSPQSAGQLEADTASGAQLAARFQANRNRKVSYARVKEVAEKKGVQFGTPERPKSGSYGENAWEVPVTREVFGRTLESSIIVLAGSEGIEELDQQGTVLAPEIAAMGERMVVGVAELVGPRYRTEFGDAIDEARGEVPADEIEDLEFIIVNSSQAELVEVGGEDEYDWVFELHRGEPGPEPDPETDPETDPPDSQGETGEGVGR